MSRSEPEETIDAGRALLSGSFWITLSELAQGGAEIAATIVAAQRLGPDDFGLMGVALLIVATLQAFSQTGFDQALVQSEQEIAPFLNIAWTIQFARGAMLAGCLILLGPHIAHWYARPILEPILYAISGYVFVLGLHNVGVLYFQRELDFRTICFMHATKAVVHAAVAIPAIIYFKNVWGLMVGAIAGATVSTLVSYLAHPFRPRFEWEWKKAKQLVRYGKWIGGMAMIGFVVTQADDFFVSGYFGIAALGFYQMAYNVSNLPATKITHVISKVSFPTYARLQSDPRALRLAFLGVAKSTLVLSGTLSVAIWFLVDEWVAFVISAKWEPIVVLVRILVISAFIRSIAALGGALFQAVGRPDLDFKMNLARFFVIMIGIYPVAKFYGLEGICWLIVAALSSCGIGWWHGVQKYASITWFSFLEAITLPIVNGAVLIAAFLAAGELAFFDGVIQSILQLAAAIAIWLVGMWIIAKTTTVDLFDEARKLVTG